MGRAWSFDFAWPREKLAVEIEGGTDNVSRHTTTHGFREDCHKYNSAALLGWTVLRGDREMVKSRMLLVYVRDFLVGTAPTLERRTLGSRAHYHIPPELDPWKRPPHSPPIPAPTKPPAGAKSSGEP